MRKKIETIKCDCCATNLYDNGTRINDGTFQEPFLKLNEIDLCYNCAGKIFYKDYVENISEEDLKNSINSLKNKDKNNFNLVYL